VSDIPGESIRFAIFLQLNELIRNMTSTLYSWFLRNKWKRMAIWKEYLITCLTLSEDDVLINSCSYFRWHIFKTSLLHLRGFCSSVVDFSAIVTGADRV